MNRIEWSRFLARTVGRAATSFIGMVASLDLSVLICRPPLPCCQEADDLVSPVVVEKTCLYTENGFPSVDGVKLMHIARRACLLACLPDELVGG